MFAESGLGGLMCPLFILLFLLFSFAVKSTAKKIGSDDIAREVGKAATFGMLRKWFR
jgi:hypothetical protein